MTYSKQIGETLAETLSELFALDDLGIPLNEIRDLKTLQGHMKAAEAKYGKKHPKYATLANLHAKKTAAEARKKERHARIKTRQEYHAKNYGYKRVKGTDTWKHESGHTLNFGADRSWSHMKAGGKRPKGGGATPIRDLRNHLAKLHEGVDIVGDELNEIRSLEKLRMQANQALLKHDPIAQQKLQRALQLQQRKRGLLGSMDEAETESKDSPTHPEIHAYLTGKGYKHQGVRTPGKQEYKKGPVSVYKHDGGTGGFTVHASGQWHHHSGAGGLLSSSPNGLKTLKQHLEK